MTTTETAVTVLGLGAMGHALAARLHATDRSTTVWNRTPSRARALTERGAKAAPSVEDAVRASPLIVVCLLDAPSVHEQLHPVVGALAGRTVVNLTTTTPGEARELAAAAERHGYDYIDGGIMATPDMIGGPGAAVLYSGDEARVEQHRPTLETFGAVQFVGTDPGAAAMFDTAMLGAMYAMFAGFEQGGRMVRTAGGRAADLASMLTPFLQAMAESLADHAQGIDAPEDYRPEQSEEFTAAALDVIARSTADADQPTDLMDAVRLRLTPTAVA